MKAKTYDEWKELGYQVRRGEKSSGRDRSGAATFTREQVEEQNDIGQFRFVPEDL